MDEWQAEHDAIQFRLMRENLRHFTQGSIAIGQLVKTLEGLLSTVEEKDDAWHAAFMAKLGLLEELFSPGPDEAERKRAKDNAAITPSSMILIESAVQGLKALVDVRLIAPEEDESDGG